MNLEEKKITDLTASEFINAVSDSLAEKLKPKTYLRIEEVMQLFDITRPTIHNWTKQGILNPRKVGKRTLFLESEIHALPKDLKSKQNKLN